MSTTTQSDRIQKLLAIFGSEEAVKKYLAEEAKNRWISDDIMEQIKDEFLSFIRANPEQVMAQIRNFDVALVEIPRMPNVKANEDGTLFRITAFIQGEPILLSYASKEKIDELEPSSFYVVAGRLREWSPEEGTTIKIFRVMGHTKVA